MQWRLAWIHPDESKSGNAIGVPLNKEAKEVLSQLIGKHTDFVFTYKGKPVLRASTHAWYKACRRAGLDDFRFHDLRHTFASHWMMSGGDLFKLQRILGHKSIEMTQRYSHLSPDAFVSDHSRVDFKILHKNS